MIRMMGLGNEGDAFAHLFNKSDLSKITEAVFWKKYSIADGTFHNLSKYGRRSC